MTPLELALSYAAAGAEPYTADISDLAPNRKPQHKYRCSGVGTVAALGKIRCANGSFQYKAYCLECGGKGTNFPYSAIVGLDEDRIPVISDHEAVPCERCGSREGWERHHWAPIHLFEDAEEWPKSYLCRECHAKWHRVVTPRMNTAPRENTNSRNSA